MKKLISIIVALMLAMSLTAAFAENVTEIKWADFSGSLADLGAGTDFITFDDVAVKMWMPNVMSRYEVDEDMKKANIVDLYSTEDGDFTMFAMIIDAQFNDISEFATSMADTVKDPQLALINGLGTFSYTPADDPNTACVSFILESGKVFVIAFTPVADESLAAVAGLMTASIQPE
jgi:hypothetical protein